ncbi:MAG TPA: EamA family transporter, partial [Rubrobacter sp.]|nr:EamA family transporter [Rubrobacter sp.]
VLLGWREIRSLDLSRWGALIFVGWGGSAVATILFTTGLFKAFEAGAGSVNTVLLLQQTQPLFAIAAAAVVLGERLTVLYAPIFAVAAIGAYLLAFGDLIGEPGGLFAPFTQVGRARLEFALAALGAAALWGTSTAMGRYLGGRLSFQTLTGARFLVALPLLLVWAAIAIPDAAGSLAGGLAEPQVARKLVLLALFPGLLGLLLYYRGLRSTPASYATLAELAYPATGVTLNWLLLGQPLTVAQGVGVALVVGAIAAMNRVKSGVRVRRSSQGG